MDAPAPRPSDPAPRAPARARALENALAFGLAIVAADATSLVAVHALMTGTPLGLDLIQRDATWVLGRGALDGLAIGLLDVWWRRRPGAWLVRRLLEAFVASYLVCVLFQTADVLHLALLGRRVVPWEVLLDAWRSLPFLFSVWGLSVGFVLAVLLRGRPWLAGFAFAFPRWFTDDLVTYVVEGHGSVPAAESGTKLAIAVAAVLEIGVLVGALRSLVPLALDALGVVRGPDERDRGESEREPPAPPPGLP